MTKSKKKLYREDIVDCNMHPREIKQELEELVTEYEKIYGSCSILYELQELINRI